jgi:hypothetical protein
MESIDATKINFQPQYFTDVLDARLEDGPGREGGDDAIVNADPNDSKLDEKVIVNEQRSNKTVNAPSQTAANTSEDNASDDDLIDDEGNEENQKDKKS